MTDTAPVAARAASTKSSEATKGGFAGVVEVAGELLPIMVIPPKYLERKFGGEPRDQALIKLKNADILEMAEGESEPELKDGTFTIYMDYNVQNKPKPSANMFYARFFLKSGEALDAKIRGVDEKDGDVSNLYGKRIVLRKETKSMGEKDGKKLTKDGFVFKLEGNAPETPEAIDEHIRKLVVGNMPATAKRNILLDIKGKKYPEYKEAIDNGTLATRLNLVMDSEGKFALPG